MVPGRQVIPVDISLGSGPPSGSVRNRIQLQTQMLCSPKPGSSGIRNRRPVSRLEPMEQDIPIPTGQLLTESSSQTENFQRETSPGSTQLAEEQLVPSPDGAEAQTISNPKSGVISDSANKDCISFIMANKSADFMDFLKFAANRRFQIDSDNISFTESDKTESTVRQYNSAFCKLTSFIHQKNVSEMPINTTLSFFRSLYESGLASSTITTTKSALVKVFPYGFGLDLNDLCFSSSSRACAKQRPALRPAMLLWSLNKVL